MTFTKHFTELSKDDANILGLEPHPNQKKYPHQFLLTIYVKKYACAVPFVADDEKVFFKTLYQSRAAKKRFLKT